MPAKLRREDGTGRPPRPLQNEFMDWLEANLDGPEVLAGQLPTGVGKSFIARMLQMNFGASVVVPSNVLMDDTYTRVYDGVNALKGKAHYQCNTHEGFSCGEVKDALKKGPCPGCPYATSRRAALRGAPTFYNPMSLFYLQKAEGYVRPDMIVVDEADKLKDMLILMSGKQFRQSKYQFPETTSELEVAHWMRGQLVTLHRLYGMQLEAGQRDAVTETGREIESVEACLKGLEENPQNYVCYITDGFTRKKPDRILNVIPLEPPRYLVKSLLDCKKLVLLSATLSKFDVEALLQGRPYKYLDMASPIDVKRRTVYYKPLPVPMNFKTDPAAIVKHVEKIIKENPGLNTIVHVSYAWAKKMAPLFTIPIISHDSEHKAAALETFKTNGGVFLASGFAEGVDLRGDLCRLNIVPMLHRLNPFEPAVKKRLALNDGQRWYDSETIRTLVQAAGRGTRGEDDFSKIVVCDPAFPNLVIKGKQDIPKSFMDAISWRYKGSQG